MKIVCVGDCGVDHYLPGGDLFPGGITSNFARQARRAFPNGDEIHVICATGNDGAPAQLARSAFDGLQGIECHFSQLDGATAVQFIEIQEDGEKNFVRYEEGVIREFRVNRQQAEIMRTADLLVTPVFQQSHAMFDSVLAVPVKGRVAVDFADFAECPDFDHLVARLERIDIAFFGLQSKQEDMIDRIAALAKEYGKLMVVTLGADGSIAFQDREKFRCAALAVESVRDTTGAGDAFAAGFLSRFAHGDSVTDSLQAGAMLASQTVQCIGAVPQ
jgi:sugar/nucleoside kinase (ribokinase family)